MTPLFPLRTVLFPGGFLPLRIFEQRYIAMAKACLQDDSGFGVCLITRGEEVNAPEEAGTPHAPEFATVGTMARIREWDMPHLGILHVLAEGGQRFKVQSHSVREDGLIVGELGVIAAEAAQPVDARYRPLVELLQLLASRVGPRHFPEARRFDDASWVGYRLAELLPLPLTIKQSMLEINESEIRLAVLLRFLREQDLL